jgi:predicted SAM-dependent methyltransferase
MKRFRQALKHIYHNIFNRKYYYCPVCKNYFPSYGTFKNTPECPLCYSLDRHRLVWLYMERKTDLLSDTSYKLGRKKFLDIAPERCIEARLRRTLGAGYITADLYADNVDVKMDITDIHYPDESFDAIYCSHVLEHVSDDRKAMREFRRVLKIGGWAVIMVPIIVENSMEDPAVTDPQERLRLYGQEDHVRAYGPDFKERLESAGFTVEIVTPSDILTKKEMEKMQVVSGGGELLFCLFFCRKIQ